MLQLQLAAAGLLSRTCALHRPWLLLGSICHWYVSAINLRVGLDLEREAESEVGDPSPVHPALCKGARSLQ
jgi:hypothetical protein